MKLRYWFVLILASCLIPGLAWACTSKGPQDPYTGMITYPNGQGNGSGTTKVPDLPGTPFAGGNFYKAWKGDGMQVIIIPAGTTLTFDGVIQSANPINPPRPPFWEEGEAQELFGSLVDNAPRPTWTIFGNGGGDYAPGQAPPSGPGAPTLKFFEKGPDCMIAPDTPAVKALWKLSYDQGTAINMLGMANNDPTYKAAIQKMLPAGVDFVNVLQSGRDPQYDMGAKGLKEFEISPTGPEGVEGLKRGLREALPHLRGIQSTEDPVNRAFTNADGTGSYTKSLPVNAGLIIDAGYIAMQEWYPSGKYNTKYFVTPPSGDKMEFGGAKMTKTFGSPTAPDFWTIDLNSGLESTKDCVWCWIEAKGTLKNEKSPVDPAGPLHKFYNLDPNSIAIGGVMVRGYYQSDASSAGRNTLTYVIVVDTEPPAAFEWIEPFNILGETGKTLASTNTRNKMMFRVYDNNPVLGAEKSENIHTAVPNLGSFEFVAADKRSKGGQNMADLYNRYIAPIKDGFGEANLAPRLIYNVCVPSCLGLKVTGSDKELDKYGGPFPILQDRMVLLGQRFVWKTVATPRIMGRMIYQQDGKPVAGLKDLQENFEWSGYSSVDFEVPMEDLNEPMGTLFAEGSRRYDLNFQDAGLVGPASAPMNGVPIQQGKLQFYPWSDKALKFFPVAQDGVGNQTPSPNEVNGILATRLSGLDLKSPDDAVATWTDPADLDGTIAPSPIKGGKLGNINALPGQTGTGTMNWGKFAFVKELKDKGRPQIALEVRNAKNEKAIIYGNQQGLGEVPGYWEALSQAGNAGWCVATDTNVGALGFLADSPNDADDRWVFQDAMDRDLYLEMQGKIESGKFRPWLYNLPENTNIGLPIWAENYWNGQSTYNNDQLAYQQGNRDRLLFRYWAWDNINTYDWTSGAEPNGLKLQTGDREFKAVKADKITARVTLIDKPAFPDGEGKVPASKVWWPDYIFQNPSHRRDGTYEECSITLESQDAAGNKPRVLKVYFRIIPPGMETIRTIEENRERK